MNLRSSICIGKTASIGAGVLVFGLLLAMQRWTYEQYAVGYEAGYVDAQTMLADANQQYRTELEQRLRAELYDRDRASLEIFNRFRTPRNPENQLTQADQNDFAR